MRFLLICYTAMLFGCDSISSLSLNTTATGDPNNPNNIGVGFGGTVTFREPRRLPNYSKDK